MTKIQWPRYWYNYPIVLCGIGLQYIWALAITIDANVVNATAINIFLPYLHRHGGPFVPNDWDFGAIRWSLVFILTAIASLSFVAFQFRKKIHTVLALLPQQFVLALSSGGIIHGIYFGQFADGTVRTPAFLFADQSPVLLFTLFHTWAVILILLHGTDEQ